MKKLYLNRTAPNPRKVITLMQAKGLNVYNIDDIEVIDIDFAKEEQFSDEFTNINPWQLVPVLKLVDGTVIHDSQAICEYIDRVYGETSLMGSDVVHRAKVCAMRRTAELEVLYHFMMGFQHGHPSKANRVDQVTEYSPKAVARGVASFPFFENILKDHEFLVNDQLSFADIVLYIALDFGRLHKVRPTEQTDGIARFYTMMNDRFGMKK